MFDIYRYCSTIENTTFLIKVFFSIGVIVISLEYLTIHQQFKPDGVFSWKLFSSRPDYINNKLLYKRADFIFGYYGFLTLNVLNVICCLLLPFINDHFSQAALILIVAVSSLLMSYRNIVGSDGSDQMNTIIYIPLLIAYFFDDPFTSKLCLIFIAAQSIISYVIAGVAKLISTKWRSGVAIPQIMNTRSYGHPGIAEYLFKSSQPFKYVLSWFVMLFETFFFLVVFLPYPFFFIFLIGGLLFHIYNGIMMGLNNFFWSFTATYPAIIFTNVLLHIK